MKSTTVTRAIEKVVELKLRAIDRLIEELVLPLETLGSPEKLIGKPYELWGAEDFSRLARVYGAKEPNPLSELIMKKEYEKVLEAEKELLPEEFV